MGATVEAVKVITRDGDAVPVADGGIGASIRADGRTVVLPVASLAAHGDWEPADKPIPANAPADLADQIAAVRAYWLP
jgi:hypothetical protein